jgi:cytochrome c-type biogenesis protein CcmE
MSVQTDPRSRPRQWRFLVGGVVIVAAIAYLILSSTQGAVVYALTITELKSRGSSIYGQGVRVGGAVDGDSITWDASRQTLEFNLIDGSESLPVTYTGVRPDMFRDGAEALLEGKYHSSGLFEASKILLKCPSKYEAAATQTATK